MSTMAQTASSHVGGCNESKEFSLEDLCKIHPNDIYQSETADKYSKEYLPKIFLTNAQSLQNKLEYLKLELKKEEEEKECHLVCITETWEKGDSPKCEFSDSLNGYMYICERRHVGEKCCNVERGGGLIAYCRKGKKIEKIDQLCEQINQRKIKDRSLETDVGYEIMPFFYRTGQAEDIPPVIFILVYITSTQEAGILEAKKRITKCYELLLQWSKGGPVFLLGDFNKCEFTDVKVKSTQREHILKQYVTCPTRGESILDKCYGNIPGAYSSKCRRPLGKSDHNVIFLNPGPAQNECTHPEAKKDPKRGLEQQMGDLSLAGTTKGKK
ncbi:uncharacterized protein LOC134076332 [Sardina pilchardus]|uniref:uncharacterized protein LOC134076332 n=1 Tax=Sardina pilchardus TaxID=27697 RepID=UPI002E10D7EA